LNSNPILSGILIVIGVIFLFGGFSMALSGEHSFFIGVVILLVIGLGATVYGGINLHDYRQDKKMMKEEEEEE
jgi:membrane-bound ClpP family serine protease